MFGGRQWITFISVSTHYFVISDCNAYKYRTDITTLFRQIFTSGKLLNALGNCGICNQKLSNILQGILLNRTFVNFDIDILIIF